MEDVQYDIVEGDLPLVGPSNQGERLVRFQSNGLVIHESKSNGKKVVKIYHRASAFNDKVKKTPHLNTRPVYTKQDLKERGTKWKKWQKDVDEEIEAVMKEEERIANLRQINPPDPRIISRESETKAWNKSIKIQLFRLQEERDQLDEDLRGLKNSEIDLVEARKNSLRQQAEHKAKQARQKKERLIKQAEEDEYLGKFEEEEDAARIVLQMIPHENQTQVASIPHHLARSTSAIPPNPSSNQTGYAYHPRPLADENHMVHMDLSATVDGIADSPPLSGMNTIPLSAPGNSSGFARLPSHPLATSTHMAALDPANARLRSPTVSGPSFANRDWRESVSQWTDEQVKSITLRVCIKYDEDVKPDITEEPSDEWEWDKE